VAVLLKAWQTPCEKKYNNHTVTEFSAQGRAWTSHVLSVVDVELRRLRLDQSEHGRLHARLSTTFTRLQNVLRKVVHGLQT